MGSRAGKPASQGQLLVACGNHSLASATARADKKY